MSTAFQLDFQRASQPITLDIKPRSFDIGPSLPLQPQGVPSLTRFEPPDVIEAEIIKMKANISAGRDLNPISYLEPYPPQTTLIKEPKVVDSWYEDAVNRIQEGKYRDRALELEKPTPSNTFKPTEPTSFKGAGRTIRGGIATAAAGAAISYGLGKLREKLGYKDYPDVDYSRLNDADYLRDYRKRISEIDKNNAEVSNQLGSKLGNAVKNGIDSVLDALLHRDPKPATLDNNNFKPGSPFNPGGTNRYVHLPGNQEFLVRGYSTNSHQNVELQVIGYFIGDHITAPPPDQNRPSNYLTWDFYQQRNPDIINQGNLLIDPTTVSLAALPNYPPLPEFPADSFPEYVGSDTTLGNEQGYALGGGSLDQPDFDVYGNPLPTLSPIFLPSPGLGSDPEAQPAGKNAPVIGPGLEPQLMPNLTLGPNGIADKPTQDLRDDARKTTTITAPLPSTKTPPNCEDPCIEDIRRKLDKLNSDHNLGLITVVDWLDNLLSHLIDLQHDVDQLQNNGTGEGGNDGSSNDLSQVTQLLEEIKVLDTRVFKILGGSSWYAANADTPQLTINPENLIKSLGDLHYANNAVNDVTVPNILGLIEAIQAAAFYRAGLHQMPATVPKTLLTYSDGETQQISNTADFLAWFVGQFDALIGQFPIEIEIEDVDPTQQGNQTKKIELPNLSEAIAELYGLAITSSTNSDVSINMLMRLAAEMIATKNSSLITQDYVKANASYLGYKGNPKTREIDYSFDPTKLDTLDQLLKESKGNVIGWEEEDKNTVAEYLQKLMFSAGILKAAFFRNGNLFDHFKKEVEDLATGSKRSDSEAWERFKQEINDPESEYNKYTDNPQPRLKETPFTDSDNDATTP